MQESFKTVGLFGKYKDASVGNVINELTSFLQQRGLKVLLGETTAAEIARPLAESRPYVEIGKEIDLAIVVGGDGTMLHAARALAGSDALLVGVNMGRLGFLADIPAANMRPQLTEILEGKFQIEDRSMLHAEISHAGKVVYTANAFNDVVINKGELARLIEFETYIDGDFVNSTRGDGVIIATPTGSTAYALSAGGPILHPTLPAFVLVPICPHALSNRPLAVNSSSVIRVVMVNACAGCAYVSFDGQLNHPFEDGDRIEVRRAAKPIRLVRPLGHNHYEVLRVKLRWGEKV